jgi:hypothetical protein
MSILEVECRARRKTIGLLRRGEVFADFKKIVRGQTKKRTLRSGKLPRGKTDY